MNRRGDVFQLGLLPSRESVWFRNGKKITTPRGLGEYSMGDFQVNDRGDILYRHTFPTRMFLNDVELAPIGKSFNGFRIDYVGAAALAEDGTVTFQAYYELPNGQMDMAARLKHSPGMFDTRVHADGTVTERIWFEGGARGETPQPARISGVTGAVAVSSGDIAFGSGFRRAKLGRIAVLKDGGVALWSDPGEPAKVIDGATVRQALGGRRIRQYRDEMRCGRTARSRST